MSDITLVGPVNLRSRRPAGERERAWLPAAGDWVRLLRLLFPAALSIVPALGAQEPARPPAADTAARPGMGVRLRFPNDSLVLERPAALGPFGRLAPARDSGATIADREAASIVRMTEVARAARWAGAWVALSAAPAGGGGPRRPLGRGGGCPVRRLGGAAAARASR